MIYPPKKGHFKKIKRIFTWKTQDGDVLNLSKMKTSHICNCMKMCFNHLTDTVERLKPISFNKKHSGFEQMASFDPDKLALIMWIFFKELEDRELDIKTILPYKHVKKQYKQSLKLRDLVKEGYEEYKNTYHSYTYFDLTEDFYCEDDWCGLDEWDMQEKSW